MLNCNHVCLSADWSSPLLSRYNHKKKNKFATFLIIILSCPNFIFFIFKGVSFIWLYDMICMYKTYCVKQQITKFTRMTSWLMTHITSASTLWRLSGSEVKLLAMQKNHYAHCCSTLPVFIIASLMLYIWHQVSDLKFSPSLYKNNQIALIYLRKNFKTHLCRKYLSQNDVCFSVQYVTLALAFCERDAHCGIALHWHIIYKCMVLSIFNVPSFIHFKSSPEVWCLCM